MNVIDKVPAPVELTVQHENKQIKGVILIKHERRLGKKCKVLWEHIAKISNLV